MTAGTHGATIRAWHPRVAGIREVFHATIAEHAYPPHMHDAWTLFVVDAGSIRYDLDRQARGAGRSMVSVLPPHVVHDGRPATTSGFQKRVLYLEPHVLGEDLIGATVDQPEIPDPGLRSVVSALHDALACPDDALEAETRLGLLAERIRTAYGNAAEAPAEVAPVGRLPERFRAWLDEHLFDAVSLAAAARDLEVSPTRLTRTFSGAFGLAPHAYLTGRRVHAARDRIVDGMPLAQVAAETGFCDQAHLTRRFRQVLGATPGQFAPRR